MRYLWLCLLVGCVETFAPPDAIRWTPPAAEMDSLWRATETCSGLTGDWHRIDWYIVRAHEFASPVGEVIGLWDGDHSIYLANPYYPQWAPEPRTIQHEMLHALAHTATHPAVFDTCGLR